MRINLPVSDIEYPIGDDTLILSTTDTKGRLTYVNQTFIEVSGFTKEELIGKAHNIVRHPDMPSEAFADLWKTLKGWQAVDRSLGQESAKERRFIWLNSRNAIN